MAIENKEALISKISLLEEKIKTFEPLQHVQKEFQHLQKEFEAIRKLKDEAINREFELRKERDKLKADNAELVKQIEGLKIELNKLASLFDEYAVAFQDQTRMLAVFVKNTQNIERYLQTKIDAFNRVPEPKKEK
jgi:chromosome segregation ATPase